MSWTARMIEALAEAKREGYTFKWAWDDAIRDNPPRGRDCGPERPTLLDTDESPVEFFRRVCEDAWMGRRPLLAHMPGLLDMVGDDQSVLAGQSMRRRMTMIA